MQIEYDAAKRELTLKTRRLDMAAASDVFADPHLTYPDTRREYGEERFITLGHLNGRLIFVAWTPRGDARRIISMRKANAREQARYAPILGR